MTEQLQPDICVIGAGSAGLSVAGAAAVLGVPVVLIEKEDMASRADARLASSALIAAGRRTQAVRDSAAFGVDAMGVAIDFGAVQQHVNRVVNASAGDRSLQRLTALGIHVVNGSARFADRDSVIAGDYTIKARRFVIATGSAPLLPAIPGLDGVPFLTRETVFSLQDCPQHLLVIGSGAAALEFAQAFRRFGAAVTVLTAEQFLAAEDAECANIVLGRLAREGVVLRPAVTITRVSHAPGKITIVLTTDGAGETIEGSHVLVADGLRPVVEGLDLDTAGIQRSAAGIIVNERLRTTNKRVYAAGSVTGLPSAHAADYHAGLVIRNALFRFPAKADDKLVPRVTFTDPELAHVGLSETEARGRHAKIRIMRWPFFENDRAQAERQTDGHIKVVTTARGRILGATIVGADAGEQIAAWMLALKRGLNIRDFATMAFAYPTRAEAAKRVAVDFLVPGLTSPMLRRIIRWLRRFG